MKKEYRKIMIKSIIISCAILLASIALFNILHLNDYLTNTNKITEVTQPTTSQLDFTPHSTESRGISLPTTNGLVMKADQLEQTVDFYNPASNKVYFKMDIALSDGTIIYQSDYLKPDEHIKKIKLTKVLDNGVYRNCKITYHCYSLERKIPVNNAEVTIEINSV